MLAVNVTIEPNIYLAIKWLTTFNEDAFDALVHQL